MIKGQRAGSEPIAVDVTQGKTYAWCACGKSKNQPFCDGSHKDSKFNPIISYSSKLFNIFNKIIPIENISDIILSNYLIN